MQTIEYKGSQVSGEGKQISPRNWHMEFVLNMKLYSGLSGNQEKKEIHRS